jgi:universal stress protein A
MLSLNTILCATDFSTSSEYAFRLAASLAEDHKARLVILHVAEAPHASLYKGVPVSRQLDEQEREQQEKLDALQPPAGVAVERRMVLGDPGEEILKIANELKADLIVMGTHGRTGLRRMVTGSVAERVLRHAPCPVLAVKTPQSTPKG